MPKKWVPEDKYVIGQRLEIPDDVVKSAARVVQILEVFDEIRRPATVVELCSKLGYPQSSTSALLRTLTRMGYLTCDPDMRTYVPTYRVAILGNWVDDRLFGHGQLIQAVNTINTITGHLVILAARNGNCAQYIHVAQARKSSRLQVTLGIQRHLVMSGFGYVILSNYSDEHIRRIAHVHNAYATPKDKKVQIADLLEKVSKVRELGYCFEPNIAVLGGAVVALPVPGTGSRQPLAIGIGGPTKSLQCSVDKYVELMHNVLSTHFVPDDDETESQKDAMVL